MEMYGVWAVWLYGVWGCMGLYEMYGLQGRRDNDSRMYGCIIQQIQPNTALAIQRPIQIQPHTSHTLHAVWAVCPSVTPF